MGQKLKLIPFQMLLLILQVGYLLGCAHSKIIGKVYQYKEAKRSLSVFFKNDSLCQFKNIFNCKDLDRSLQEIIIDCSYKRFGDTLFIRNKMCQSDTCQFALGRLLETSRSEDCPFLVKPLDDLGALRHGRTNHDRYAIVPNIDIDTLYLIRREVVLVKKDGSSTTLIVFK